MRAGTLVNSVMISSTDTVSQMICAVGVLSAGDNLFASNGRVKLSPNQKTHVSSPSTRIDAQLSNARLHASPMDRAPATNAARAPNTKNPMIQSSSNSSTCASCT